MKVDNINIYILTTKNVIHEGWPIIRVIHDEDGDWQFLGDEENLTEDDAVIVSLEEIITIDNSLSEVTSLPKGKQALRNNIDEPWYVYDL